MAQTHEHVDLQVMAEVERLLTTTSFATIDELASRLEVDDLASTSAPRAARAAAPRPQPVLVTGEACAPLPRRR